MSKKLLFANEYRKIIVPLLSLIMGVSFVFTPGYVKAEETVGITTETVEAENDLMEVQSVEVSSFAVMKGRFLHNVSQQKESEDEVTVSVDDRNWQLYRTTYVFDQMNAKEKELYNGLEAVCMDYAKNSDKDAIFLKSKNGNGAYYLPSVSVKDLEYEEYVNTLQLFIYSNPQYYFTTCSFAISGDELYLYCYPAFADGEDRAQATNSLFATVDTWLKTVKDEDRTTTEIEKAAHDLLCNNISYDYDAVEQMNSGDYSGDAYYTQSIYSAIQNHKSVCAGYSLTFELLMNAAGIPTVTAYSDYHAWNKVLLSDGCWYAVDVTWDDCDDGSRISYSFYNKSDLTIQKYDDDQPVHVVKMSGYYPVAAKDYDESEYVEVVDNTDDIEDTADIELTAEDTVNVESEDNGDDTVIVETEDSNDDSTIVETEDSNDDSTIVETEDSNDDSTIVETEDNSDDAATVETAEENDSVGNTDIPDKKTVINSIDINNTNEDAVVVIPVADVENELTTIISDNNDNVETTAIAEKTPVIGTAKISKVKAGLRKCKITWKKVKNIAGYEIQLSTTKNFTKVTKKVKVSKASSSVIVKKLKKKTTYYVRIRTYNNIDGKRIVSDWSGVKKVTVK